MRILFCISQLGKKERGCLKPRLEITMFGASIIQYCVNLLLHSQRSVRPITVGFIFGLPTAA